MSTLDQDPGPVVIVHPTWPKPGEHLFGEWMSKDKATMYRQCVHPNCHHYEERPVPTPKG